MNWKWGIVFLVLMWSGIGCGRQSEPPEATPPSAQQLLEQGHAAAAQTNLTAALQAYDKVGEVYPDEDWLVLMAWKSAADLLWDQGRFEEARAYYRRIVERFDLPGAQQVVLTVVKGSQARLETAP